MTTEPKKSAPKNIFTNNRWLIFIAIIGFLLYLLLPVLTPFLVAAILAYISDPLVDKLSVIGKDKLVIGRTLATVLVMIAIFGGITLLFLILVPLLQKESFLIAERLPTVIGNIRNTIEPWLQAKFGISFAIDSTQIQQIITKNWKTAGDLLTWQCISDGGQPWHGPHRHHRQYFFTPCGVILFTTRLGYISRKNW